MGRQPERGGRARPRLVVVALGLLTGLLALPSSDAAWDATTTASSPVATANAYSYAAVVTASAPWLWWRLGETGGTTAADASGNGRTGTLSRVGLSPGVTGAILGDSSTAAHFDGQGGCVVGSATQTNPTTFTLEIWFRTTTRAGGLLVGFGATGAVPSGAVTEDRQLFMTAAGNLAFGTAPGAVQTITSPGTYNDGRWHLAHAVLSPGGGAQLYADGVLVASGASGAANVTAVWRAGCGTVRPGFTGAPLAGHLEADLDEIAVYSTALSAAAVSQRITAAPTRRPYADAVGSSLPWAFWPLGEGTSATVADTSGNGRTATSSASGVTANQSGAVVPGVASAFNGSSGCLVAGTAQANPTTFSVEAWFRTTSTLGGPVIGFMNNSTADPTGSSQRDRHVYLNGSGTVSFGVLASGTREVVSSPSGGYNDGAWHHVVASLSPAGQVLYLDGVAVAYGANTAAQNFTGYWHVGCQNVSTSWANYPGSFYWNGAIDDVAVYTTALDAATVQRHFRAGSSPPDYPTAVAAASPWAWWRLGEQLPYGIGDSSGNSNRAWSSNGGITRGVPGVLDSDNAMRFDGTSGCTVSVGTQANPTTFSLEAWFRTTSTTGGPILGFTTFGEPNRTSGHNYDRILYLRSSGVLSFGTGSGGWNMVTTTAAYNDGRWHHVVASVSPSATVLYVDGVPVGATATGSSEATTGYWKIGCSDLGGWPGGTDYYLDADIDEVAVYATALSATAAASHFRAGAGVLSMPAARATSPLVGVWRLNETTGTALADDTGNGFGATASASGVTYGVPGALAGDPAVTFDGASGCAVAATSSADPQSFSIEAWFRTTTAGGSIIGFNPVGSTAFPGSPYDRGVFMRDDGRLSFMVYPNSFSTVTTAAPYHDGVWHHVVATLGPDGQKLYVDGALAASNANTVAYGYSGYWRIGCNNMSTWPGAPTNPWFTGTIDEVAVYQGELDAATIAYRHALVTRPAAASEVAVMSTTPTLAWAFDESSGNPQDSSGNARHGTSSGSGITRSQAPAVGRGTSWTFNGSSGCTVSNASFVNPTVFTVESWFRTTSTTGGGIAAFTQNSAATTSATNWDRLLWMRDNGTVSFGIFDAGARPVITSGQSYHDGRWHHVAASVGPAGMRLYVDGVEVATNPATAVENFTGYWHAGCGKYDLFSGTPTSAWFSGALDEFVISPVQLSAAAVKARYDAGNGTHPFVVRGSGIITTFAGTGTYGNSGDGGAATAAALTGPGALAVQPDGTVYIMSYDGCVLRRVDPNGVMARAAGTTVCTANGDGGAATSAAIDGGWGLAVAPDGGVYVADYFNYRVRKISPSGIITTYAGNGNPGSTGDGGQATSATLNDVIGLAVDAAGNLYISTDAQCRVRRVTPAGVISTVVGTGTCSTSGDGGAATSATINDVFGMWVGPDGSLYLSDFRGCRVRKVTNGIITTILGNGTCSTTGNGGLATSATIDNPAGIVGDGYGTLYVVDNGGRTVRRIDPAGIITTVVGTGSSGSGGDGGAATSATMTAPYALALDPAGRLLVADYAEQKVRRVG